MNREDLTAFQEERIAFNEEARRIHENIMNRLNKISSCTERITNNLIYFKKEKLKEKDKNYHIDNIKIGE